MWKLHIFIIRLFCSLFFLHAPIIFAQTTPHAEFVQTPPPNPHAPVITILSLDNCCPSAAWPEAEKILFKECSASGFHVAAESLTGESAQTPLLDLVSSYGAGDIQILLRVTRLADASEGTVEFVAIDGDDGELVFRQIPIAPITNDFALSGALKIVEILRVTLLELGMEKPSPSAKITRDNDEPEAPVASLPPANRKQITWGMGLLGSAIFSAGGMGPLGGFGLDLSVHHKRLSVHLEGTVTAFGQTVTVQRTTASFDVGALRTWVRLSIFRFRRVHSSIGLGGGMIIPWSKGNDAFPYGGSTVRTVVAYLGGTARVKVLLGGPFYAIAGFQLGVLLPEVRIQFQEMRIVTFGHPLMEANLGVEIDFP